MNFIFACIAYILWMALMFIMMFAAFELAIYLIGFAIELCVAITKQGWRVVMHNPLRTLKDAHDSGWALITNQRFAIV